ncbi:c-type cytochrome [Desulforhopalus singaporensis]|uniref:Cytochrome C oxidase, cbb3-type, subunit III n=1 Tax=Desulforhopalus singaporensis TaxID=91360 RepID=A0A1H0LVG6_9BACT|nr:c-type cytochrome [Desulforhopalus singaporensis]SDO72167.1 Cytochrome C oxidase, cbb3-type, subunit III [Desulforhopalus singaporensis]
MKNRLLWICAGVLVLTIVCFQAVAHEWMAPRKAAELTSPLAVDDVVVAAGKKVYQENCGFCHGGALEGKSADQAGLAKGPPNLIKSFKAHGEGDFFWKIKEGRGDMPSFKEELSPDQIWSVIGYISSESD